MIYLVVNHIKKSRYLLFSLLVLSLFWVLLSACGVLHPEGPLPTASPIFTPEPIVPTPTQAAAALSTISAPNTPTVTPLATASTTPLAEPTPDETAPSVSSNQELEVIDEADRFGITGGIAHGMEALEAGLPFSFMLNWNVTVDAPQEDFLIWQMVRTEEAGIRRTTWEEIGLAIEANPGSYWLVGNEPDVRWQDNVTPQRYAEIYHEVYTFIKDRDPQAQVVIGGVTQPTPLRRAYLDIVLDTYEENYGEKMPIDLWNVHAFTLREERDSWGVDIPPGMDDDLSHPV